MLAQYSKCSSVAEYVAKLAQEHCISTEKTLGEDVAEAITRHAGDYIDITETQKLLIKLAQRKVIPASVMSALIIQDQRERSNAGPSI